MFLFIEMIEDAVTALPGSGSVIDSEAVVWNNSVSSYAPAVETVKLIARNLSLSYTEMVSWNSINFRFSGAIAFLSVHSFNS